MPMTPQTVRRVRLVGAVKTAALRTATFHGVEHVVVPVVALMEGVIHASNAPAPEFVPADLLALAPGGWNGRPVVPDHPWVDGLPVSANNPQILEAQAFGLLFNAHMEGTKLCVEAWLNAAQAKTVGPLAERVIERCQAGDLVEVSVGAIVLTEERAGQHNGKRYAAAWVEMIPDHLAMLPEGTPGACSTEMGCGAPRAAAAATEPVNVITDHDITISTRPVMTAAQESTMSTSTAASASAASPRRSLRERLFSLVSPLFRGAEGVSDVELRGKLHDAIRATEPGFLWIEEVYPDESVVIYAVEPEATLQLFRRSYALAADGAVTLADTREEVRPVRTYEPVTAAASTAAAPKAACGCGGNSSPAVQAAEGGHPIMAKTKQERVKALIACPKTPYTDADQPLLEQMSDERLTALEAFHSQLPAPATAAATEAQPGTSAATSAAATPATQTAAAAVVSEEEFLRTHPAIGAIVSEHRAAQQARKTELVAVLKGATDGAYTEAELQALDVAALERLAKVAKVAQPVAANATVDFTGRGTARPAASVETVEAPPSLEAAIKAARGVTS